MRVRYYCVLLGAVIGVAALYFYFRLMRSSLRNGQSELMEVVGFLASGVALGWIAGTLIERKNGADAYRVRASIYWPTIGILAFVFTKGADVYAAAFWLVSTLLFGMVVDWIRPRPSTRD